MTTRRSHRPTVQRVFAVALRIWLVVIAGAFAGVASDCGTAAALAQAGGSAYNYDLPSPLPHVQGSSNARRTQALSRDLCSRSQAEGFPNAASGVAAEETTAASRALSRFPKAAQRSEKPPGFDPETYEWREASRNIPEQHWWDPEGGEWRYHGADKWYEPHWDYNPWSQWNSPWQHIYPEAGP